MRTAKQKVTIVEEESSFKEEAEQPLIRRSARNWQPTRRYLDRDLVHMKKATKMPLMQFYSSYQNYSMKLWALSQPRVVAASSFGGGVGNYGAQLDPFMIAL